MHIQSMISAHPHVKGSTNDALIRAVEAAYGCAATCRICADACLGEAMVADLVQCIRLNLDCADVCSTTAKVLSRPGPDTSTWRSLLQACIDACTACCDHCRHHGDDHCQACADDCQACIDACQALLEQTR